MDIIHNIKKLLAAVLIVSLSAASLQALSNEALSNADITNSSLGININTANAALLADALNGVGNAKAEAIIAYREANGKFLSIDDLALVSGIGAATVELNRGLITVN
jgi:competence protein ComEA